MNLNTWKKMKTVSWALIGFSTFALSVGSSAHASGQSDTQMYCTGCHDGVIVGGNMVGGGNKNCGNRGYQGWVSTINKMNGKGCGVPASATPGMATYLTCLETGTTSSCSGGTATTTTPMTTTTMGGNTTSATTSSTVGGVTTTTNPMTGCKKGKKNKDKKCEDDGSENESEKH